MASTEAVPAVDLEDVVVRIGGKVVLGPVSLTIREGERWVLLGPNGGGKTTLLAVAGARRQPSSGRASILGLELGRGDIRTLHPDIGHTSHALSELFPPHLRVLDLVLTGKRSALSPWFQRYDADDRRRAEARLADVGCEHLVNRVFETCSQGERQRIVLARAMFGEPRLLVLDEPSAGLDLPAREALLRAVERSVSRDADLAVVIATHHLEEIPPSATHAALLREGRFVASGPIDEVVTAENMRRCFDLEIEVEHRHGRWQAIVVPAPVNPA
jgi:iron complex transport system ATP-binding protein